MNLSTSSSKLYVALAVGVVLLLIYNLFLFISPPNISVFQNQWIRNFALAERYIYLEETPEVVIVGSSMAARLDPDVVYPGSRNLSFSSAGATTGLDVIERSGQFPKLVLVETNKLELPVNEEMTDSLFTPIYWRVKRALRFLQYQYQPGNILMTWITNKFGKSDAAKAKKKVPEKIVKERTEQQIKFHSDDSKLRDADFGSLKQTLAKLTENGTQVVFFTMPAASELFTSPVYKLLDTRLSKEVGEYQHLSITADEAGQYQTTDGQHLDYASAQAYSNTLSRRINALFP